MSTIQPSSNTQPEVLRHQMAQFFDATTDAIFFLDRDYCFTFLNRRANEIVSLGKNLIGANLFEIFPATAEPGSPFLEHYRRTMDHGAVGDFEAFYPEPFNIWFRVKSYPADDGIMVFFRDVTDEKESREALLRTSAEAERERSRLATIIDTVPVGLVFADADGSITGGNKQAERIFRHPVHLSKDIDSYAEWVAFHPDGRRVLAHEYPLAKTLTDGKGHTGEFLHQCGDGSQKWVTFTSAAFHDPTGNLAGAVVVTLDIDERKRAQDALREKSEQAERQRAEIETLYRTAPIGLALFDTEDYRYLRLNDRQAAFFGLDPDQIVGKTLTQMAPIEGLRELFDGVRDGTPVVNFPLEGELATDPDNHRYWTVSYFPVHAPDGSVQAISAASLEVTQQKKAEQALIQSEKLAVVGRLASSIAHEINNPLEAVTNLLFLAQNSQHLDEVHAFLRSAEVELRRVGAITSQTLRFHKQATSPRAITAQDLIESVLSIHQGRIHNTAVRIETRIKTHQPVRCFEGEIRQVISNLVGNALDAMNSRDLLSTGSHQGRLLLRSREATNPSTGERGLVITVADTGIGMSPQTLAKLFNPFFTTKGIIGTGLGLWVSKEIVDRHNGKLRVRSSTNPTHRGTVFTLFLPFNAVNR